MKPLSERLWVTATGGFRRLSSEGNSERRMIKVGVVPQFELKEIELPLVEYGS